MANQKVLTTKQVADIFQVRDYTIREWIKLGKIKAVKIGRRWMVSAEEVDRIIKEGV